MATTPKRSIRIENDLWQEAEAYADREGVTVSDVIRVALDDYLRGADTHTAPAPTTVGHAIPTVRHTTPPVGHAAPQQPRTDGWVKPTGNYTKQAQATRGKGKGKH